MKLMLKRMPVGPRRKVGRAPTGGFAAMIATLGLVACSAQNPGNVSAGHAFARADSIQVGAKPIRTGTELGFLALFLENISSATLTITAIPIHGAGVGSVVKVVQEEIAPLNLPTATPGALYETNPPAMWLRGMCHVQPLRKVHGYQLQAGQSARLWVIFRALRPGKYQVPNHVVYYSEGGFSFRQVVDLGYIGSVTNDVKNLPVIPQMTRCLNRTVSLLPGWSSH